VVKNFKTEESPTIKTALESKEGRHVLICAEVYNCGAEWVQDGVYFEFPELK
jgi:hypothetical protein